MVLVEHLLLQELWQVAILSDSVLFTLCLLSKFPIVVVRPMQIVMDIWMASTVCSMKTGHGSSNGAGSCLDSDVGYSGGSGSCPASCTKYAKPRDISYGPVNNEAALMDWVVAQPVVVAMDGDDWQFQAFGGGTVTVYDDDGLYPCSSNVFNHNVLLVGYGTMGTGVQYWIIQNSWGTIWNWDGFAFIKRGNGGAGKCGIAGSPSIPVYCTPGTSLFHTGSYTYPGDIYCSDCGAGNFDNGQLCDYCPAGKYQPYARGVGLTSCLDCPPGKFSIGNSNPSCTDCLAGHYNPYYAQTSCNSICPAGTYAAAGSGTCTSCGAGRYQPNTGSGACYCCSLNKYQPNLVAISCLNCPAGKSTDMTCSRYATDCY